MIILTLITSVSRPPKAGVDTAHPADVKVVSKRTSSAASKPSFVASKSSSTTSSEPMTKFFTASARTTAKHDIIVKTSEVASGSKKVGKKDNSKIKDNVPEPEKGSLSDEDDSQEREAALASPLKAKELKALSKVRISSFCLVTYSDEQCSSDQSQDRKTIESHWSAPPCGSRTELLWYRRPNLAPEIYCREKSVEDSRCRKPP